MRQTMIAAVLVAVATPTVAQGREGIRWSASLEAGRAEARRSGRPLILYFTFDT